MVCAVSVCISSIDLKASSVDEADVGSDDDNVVKAVMTTVDVVICGTVTTCTCYCLLDGWVICMSMSDKGWSIECETMDLVV